MQPRQWQSDFRKKNVTTSLKESQQMKTPLQIYHLGIELTKSRTS